MKTTGGREDAYSGATSDSHSPYLPKQSRFVSRKDPNPLVGC